MKSQLKDSLVVLITSIFLGSCSTKVSNDIIESYKSENSFYEMALNEKSISKEDILKETEDNYKQLIIGIDPAKKVAFQKDTLFQKEFDLKKTILVELADKSQTNIALISANIAAGNRFIESLNSGEINNEEVARRQWEDFKLQFATLQNEADSIQVKITDIREELYHLSLSTLNKYGLNKQSGTSK